MKAIEFNARIDEDGSVKIPSEYRDTYGRSARLVVLLEEDSRADVVQRRPGSAKGILKIVADDEDHLDDFRDYME